MRGLQALHACCGGGKCHPSRWGGGRGGGASACGQRDARSQSTPAGLLTSSQSLRGAALHRQRGRDTHTHAHPRPVRMQGNPHPKARVRCRPRPAPRYFTGKTPPFRRGGARHSPGNAQTPSVATGLSPQPNSVSGPRRRRRPPRWLKWEGWATPEPAARPPLTPAAATKRSRSVPSLTTSRPRPPHRTDTPRIRPHWSPAHHHMHPVGGPGRPSP